MRRRGCIGFLTVLFLLSAIDGFPQDFPEETNDASRLEAMTERNDAEPEDDSYEQDLENWKLHPLDLNHAGSDELSTLPGLTATQIANFIMYRSLLGRLLSLYELQAVPGWELETIRALLPYIKVGKDESLYSAVRERWKGGNSSLLLRSAMVLEKSAGYERPEGASTSYYTGSPEKIFFRYSYNYKQLLQYGLTGEKDAGEPFLRNSQRYGFDFYSFHFFLRNTGIVRDLALGDYTVNLGQGLIQWQTIAFTKGGSVLDIKRQASRLRPYHSAGEFNFHRGCGITLKKGDWSSTIFVSSQKISSNPDTDTSGSGDIFTSFENSGYHRTPKEIADRNNNNQFSAGGNLGFSTAALTLSANYIHFRFSHPFLKKDEPYNLYSFKGRTLSNASFDYSYTYHNIHLFGELASDQLRHLAFVQGALLGLGDQLDFSFLYRNISAGFQSLYADAFTESGSPGNEKGLYTGLTFRPFRGLRMEMYYDLFVFPWLRYRIDAPSGGNDFIIKVFFQDDKNWWLSSEYKTEKKAGNQESSAMGAHTVFSPVKQRWQLEMGYKIDRNWRIRSRMEAIWIRKDWEEIRTKQEGFLGFLDILYNNRILNANLRIQRFLTPGYDFRIYIYENDMLFNFSLPSYFDNGWRCYVNLHKGFPLGKNPRFRSRRQLNAWIKWGESIYPGKTFTGSLLDRINGDKKSSLSAQLMFNW